LDEFYANAGVNSRDARRARSPSPRRGDRPVRERSLSPGRSQSPPPAQSRPVHAPPLPDDGSFQGDAGARLGLGAYDATPDPFEQFRKQRSEQYRQRAMEQGNHQA